VIQTITSYGFIIIKKKFKKKIPRFINKMSSHDLINGSTPIPIKYTKSYHSFSDPSSPNNKYLFCLELGLKKSFKNINKIESKKYSYIVDIDDNILYSDINYFNIFVAELPFNGQNYQMKGKIDHTLSTFSQKDENFYIEFSQNNNGSAICTCYFTGVDFNTIFVSPPN